MTSQDSGKAGAEGATVAQLKHDIDSGRTGDKVGGFDPAASPLGTDDEAAGVPPSPQTVAHARAQERSGAPNSARANAATPVKQPDARATPPLPQGMVLAAAGGVLTAVVLGVLLFAVL